MKGCQISVQKMILLNQKVKQNELETIQLYRWLLYQTASTITVFP